MPNWSPRPRPPWQNMDTDAIHSWPPAFAVTKSTDPSRKTWERPLAIHLLWEDWLVSSRTTRIATIHGWRRWPCREASKRNKVPVSPFFIIFHLLPIVRFPFWRCDKFWGHGPSHSGRRIVFGRLWTPRGCQLG